MAAATRLRVEKLEPSWLGFDTDSAPDAISKERGLSLTNYLTGDKGRIRQRGPIPTASSPINISGKRISGTIYASDNLLIGYKDADTTARTVEPQVAPYKPSTSASLATAHDGASSTRAANLLTNAVSTPGPILRSRVVRSRGTRFGKFVYYIPYDGTNETTGNIDGVLVNGRNGHERATRLCIYAPIDGFADDYTYSPRAAQDVRLHYGRLLVLGGTQPDNASLVIRHNRIWYTQSLAASDFDFGYSPDRLWTGSLPSEATNAGWKDEVTGAFNVLDLPGDQADFGVTTASVGRHLAILKRRGIVLLTGFGPSTWQMRTISDDIGCLDARSVVEANDGCFFLSNQGYMFFDGTQVIDVSRGIRSSLTKAGRDAVGDEGVAGGFAQATRLSNDYLMLIIGTLPFSASGADPATLTFAGLYHIPTNSWSNFISQIFAGSLGVDAPYFIGRTETKQYAINTDTEAIYTMPNITAPENALPAARGLDVGGYTIATTWHSKSAELASPIAKAALHRVMIDYEWMVDGGTAAQYNGPTVTVLDELGNTLDTYTLPSGADPAPGATPRQRHVRDVFSHVAQVQVRIVYTGTARALEHCTILGAWIEYAPAAERHA